MSPGPGKSSHGPVGGWLLFLFTVGPNPGWLGQAAVTGIVFHGLLQAPTMRCSTVMRFSSPTSTPNVSVVTVRVFRAALDLVFRAAGTMLPFRTIDYLLALMSAKRQRTRWFAQDKTVFFEEIYQEPTPRSWFSVVFAVLRSGRQNNPGDDLHLDV